MLVRISCNTRRNIDHRLLTDVNEAGGRSVKVLNQQYHGRDQQSHDIDWQSYTLLFEEAIGITCKYEGHD